MACARLRVQPLHTHPSSWVSVRFLIYESSDIILVFSFCILSVVAMCLEQEMNQNMNLFSTKMGNLPQAFSLNPESLSDSIPFRLSEPSISEFLFGTLQAGFCAHNFTHFHKGYQWPPYCSIPLDLLNPMFLNYVAIIIGDIFFLGIFSFLGLVTP